jgi:hypothetical protein
VTELETGGCHHSSSSVHGEVGCQTDADALFSLKELVEAADQSIDDRLLKIMLSCFDE